MISKSAIKRLKIGLIGCGNMGAAIVNGLVEAGFYPQLIQISDPDPKKIKILKKDSGCKIAKNNRQVASICDVIVLAIKPTHMDSVLDEISRVVPKQTLVISIAAGITIARIQKGFVEKVPVIRVMPNMPALIQEGISAYALGTHALPKHQAIASEILLSLGQVVEVKEKSMDAVTAISGSGPAYFFLLAEKMIEAACQLGMKANVAKQLVYQTALGSAQVLVSENEDPDVLISRVASKGGTTEAALQVYSRKGFGKIVNDAIQAAYKKAGELNN